MTLARFHVSARSLSAIALGVALVSILAYPYASKAQAAAANARLSAAQAVDLQKRFQDATVACDAATLAKLMANDVIFVHGNALVQNKAEFLEAAREKRFRIESFEISDPKVVFFDGGAIVSGIEDIALAPGAAGEQPRKVRMRVSGVWVARPAGWQLILQQSTPLQPLANAAPKPPNTTSR